MPVHTAPTSMLALVLLVALGLASWWALSPARRFRRGFARLIEHAASHWGFERGALMTALSGTYRGRVVTLQLFHPAGGEQNSFAPGEVRVSMQLRAGDGAAWKDSLANFDNPELSRATFDLEGRYGLLLTIAEGSLKASWTPPPGRFFPGSFNEERWRNTLAQMHVVAEWLENGAESRP